MLRNLIERIVLWAKNRRDRREADAVAAQYRASLPAVLDATNRGECGWLKDYREIEVPDIGDPVDFDGDKFTDRLRPSVGTYCACANSKRKLVEEEWSLVSVWPHYRLS